MEQKELTRSPTTEATRARLERKLYCQQATIQSGYEGGEYEGVDYEGVDYEGVELDIAMEALRESMTHRAMARDQARKMSRDFRNR